MRHGIGPHPIHITVPSSRLLLILPLLINSYLVKLTNLMLWLLLSWPQRAGDLPLWLMWRIKIDCLLSGLVVQC
ncbi:hypothetical protein OE88DRAFT_1655789 [Heliocybe sulcata]|uniref:Uncharacterized protein n=1 Tax=Heliocybe sulcata TaxID=5364 RepID=A0A5C3N8N0_9AGAM|nr:hypothetical protein OE88DRAFT_1655789 [Heliocybe sulcata]